MSRVSDKKRGYTERTGRHLRHTARLIGYAAYHASPASPTPTAASPTPTAAYPGTLDGILAIADTLWLALFPGQKAPTDLPDLPEGEDLEQWRLWQVIHGLDAGWQAASYNRPLGSEGEEDKISNWKLRTGRLRDAASRTADPA